MKLFWKTTARGTVRTLISKAVIISDPQKIGLSIPWVNWDNIKWGEAKKTLVFLWKRDMELQQSSSAKHAGNGEIKSWAPRQEPFICSSASIQKVLEFHWEWRKTFLRTLLESMAVCRMDLYLGFMLISFFFYSRFLGLKLPTLGQTQKWRNFKRRRWTWDGGSAPVTVGLNPSPSRLMCMRGGLISPRKRVLSLIFSLHSSSPGCLQESRRGRRWPDCGCRGKRRICNYSVNSHKWWFCSQKSGLLSIRFTNRRG